MEITRTSTMTGIKRTLDIDITEDQLRDWESGKDLIQNIMPGISADEREFIMTGVTSEEWDETFKEDEDEL